MTATRSASAHTSCGRGDKDCRLYSPGRRGAAINRHPWIPPIPRELGLFHSETADDVKAPLSNDVYQDDRGLLIVTDKWRGMDVIEFHRLSEPGLTVDSDPIASGVTRRAYQDVRAAADGTCSQLF